MEAISAMNREELMHFIAYIIPPVRKYTECMKHRNKKKLHVMLINLLSCFPEINLIPTEYRNPDILLSLYVYLGKHHASNWQETIELYKFENKKDQQKLS